MITTISCRTCPATWQKDIPENVTPTGECTSCRLARRTKLFNAQCPPLYQQTDVARLPKEKLAEVMKWKYGPRGLMLYGPSRRFKTRLVWTLLKRVLTEDRPEVAFMAFDCMSFEKDIMRHYQAEDEHLWFDKVCAAPLLFFDDFGKIKLTERAEAELFGIVERRTANLLPIILTTNDDDATLVARMSDNRGIPLVQRLREFCEQIKF